MASKELLQNEVGPDGTRRQPTLAEREAARSYAWLAFFDILVFFGVLLVGFAYLWSRGDLKWVRSLAAEEKGPAPPVPANGAAAPAGRVLAGAGS